MRHAMVRPGRDRISGIVEVDETYIGGKRTGKRGRGAADKILVVIAAQIDGPRRIGRIRLKRILDAAGNSLNRAIRECIEPGSTVITDGWEGYSQLETFGYTHKVVKKESTIGENLLPKCNIVASLLKRWFVVGHTSRQRSLP